MMSSSYYKAIFRLDAGLEGGGVRLADGAEARCGGGGRGVVAVAVGALRVARPWDSFPT
jgi:hypothetical protein